jgi:hypothetical protein
MISNILDFIEWVFAGTMKGLGIISLGAVGLISMAVYGIGMYFLGMVISWIPLGILDTMFDVNEQFFQHGFAIFFVIGMALVNIPRDRPVKWYDE